MTTHTHKQMAQELFKLNNLHNTNTSVWCTTYDRTYAYDTRLNTFERKFIRSLYKKAEELQVKVAGLIHHSTVIGVYVPTANALFVVTRRIAATTDQVRRQLVQEARRQGIEVISIPVEEFVRLEMLNKLTGNTYKTINRTLLKQLDNISMSHKTYEMLEENATNNIINAVLEGVVW